MSFKIAWLGPWNERSAIAAFGLEVVGELEARGHSVTVFRSETGDALDIQPLSGERAVHALAPSHVRTLQYGFDHVIANLGDHYGYHGAIVPVLAEVAPTGIFHDGFLANLAASRVTRAQGTTEMLRAFIREVHGAEAIDDSTDPWHGPMEEAAQHRPMAEWLTRSVAGCVTHSSRWLERLRQGSAGPVAQIPLCFPDLGAPAPHPIGETLTITTIGNVNANKRADQVLHALASDPELARRCRYQIIGDYEKTEHSRLTRLARHLGLPAPQISGHLSDEGLRGAIAVTDVIACLRHPVIEGGSASLITAMLSARPTLVSHQAHYADVPEGLVLPCRPGNEATDIVWHLRWILDNPGPARAMGAEARTYALTAYSKIQYVDSLLAFLNSTTRVAPVIRAATKLGRSLGNIGATIEVPCVERIARALGHGLPT